MMSAGVAGLAPQLYLGLNPADASYLHVKEGEQIQLVLDRVARRLPVRSMPELPKGVAGLPAGLPGLTGIVLPAWSELVAAERV
jgi:NADH-quinone oxidoreductase subunit G